LCVCVDREEEGGGELRSYDVEHRSSNTSTRIV
jgi:hypothetical protein